MTTRSWAWRPDASRAGRGASRSLGAALALLWLAGCAGDTGPITISGRRTSTHPARQAVIGAPPSQRFGGGFGGSSDGSDAAAGDSFEPPLVWETPRGWERLASSRMRLLNFRLPGNPDAECYLTALPGDGGGVVANVNRWRRQVGLADLSAEEVDALPRQSLLGGPAVLVQAQGVFTDMSGERQEDAMLVGLIRELKEFTIFIKMTGPRAALSGELENFVRLAESVDVTQEPSAPAVADGAPASAPTRAGLTSGSPLTWEAPPEWREVAAGSMRVVSFEIGSAAETECYISMVGGAGGLVANVNRWRGQVGLDPLTDGEIDALPRIVLLEGKAPLIEVHGTYRSMSGKTQSDFAILGAIRESAAGTVFVKMVGPVQQVHAERDRFITFARSLEITQ